MVDLGRNNSMGATASERVFERVGRGSTGWGRAATASERVFERVGCGSTGRGRAATADRAGRGALPRLLFLCALCASAVNLPACLPSRFVIDFSATDGRLLEKQVLADRGAPAGAPKVALIDVDGLISHSPSPALISTTSNTVDDLVARLQKAEQDSAVRAVILRVNSPGGTVAASETVYRELRSFRERTGKPIVVSMAEVAASGAYYISLAADRIVAQPSSVTGSIGVIIQTVNISRGLSWIGVEARAVRSGPNKDIANPLEPMRDEHYAILQQTVDDFHARFRNLVRERRTDAESDRLDLLTDGRIFTGRQAFDERLVDSLGDLRDAFAEAKRLAGVGRARLVKYHPEGRAPASPYALSATPPGTAGVHVSLPPALSSAPGFYYLWAPEIP